MAHTSGFEPETSASGGQRSIQLSYACATVGIVLCLGVVVQPQNLALWCFVIDESKFEQFCGWGGLSGYSGGGRWFAVVADVERQSDDKGAAGLCCGGGGEFDVAVQVLQGVKHNVQAESQVALAEFGTKERVEDFGDQLRRDAIAIVGKLQHNFMICSICRFT